MTRWIWVLNLDAVAQSYAQQAREGRRPAEIAPATAAALVRIAIAAGEVVDQRPLDDAPLRALRAACDHLNTLMVP